MLPIYLSCKRHSSIYWLRRGSYPCDRRRECAARGSRLGCSSLAGGRGFRASRGPSIRLAGGLRPEIKGFNCEQFSEMCKFEFSEFKLKFLL